MNHALRPFCILSLLFAAPASTERLVKIEFVARVLPSESCAEQRDSEQSRLLAAPGSQITGRVEYDLAATKSIESNPDVADYYYFQPKEYRALVRIGERDELSIESRGTAWISGALLGRRQGQPRMGFGSNRTGDIGPAFGDIDRLGLLLVLHVEDDAPRLNALPSAATLNAMPLSSLSRLILSGEQLPARSGQDKRALWIICGELASLSASDSK